MAVAAYFIARAALAAIALLLATRNRALLPHAAAFTALLALSACAFAPASAQAVQHVAWPGVLVWLAAAGTGRRIPPPARLAWAMAALGVALASEPAARVAAVLARLAAVVVLAVLLRQRRPRDLVELAAVAPLLGSAVGLFLGWGPLLQAGVSAALAGANFAEAVQIARDAVADGWGLAHLETGVTMAVTALALLGTGRGDAGPPRPQNPSSCSPSTTAPCER